MNKHEELRNILIKYNNPEWGDAILDEICNLFDYPTTSEIVCPDCEKIMVLDEQDKEIGGTLYDWWSCEECLKIVLDGRCE